MFAYLLGNTVYNALDVDYLRPQCDLNFMQLAANVGEQVTVWQDMVFRNLLKQNLLIEQMLDPTYFSDSLKNYPITWSQVKPLTF